MLQIQTIKPDCLALLRELMGIDELKGFRLVRKSVKSESQWLSGPEEAATDVSTK